MYSCNLAVRKSDEHTKLRPSSLTQKSLFATTLFKVVVREKEIEYEN